MRHLKQEFDKLSIRDLLIYIIAMLLVVAGLTMLFIGLWLPPIGEIHSSVLTAAGLIFTFAGACLGLSWTVGHKIAMQNQEIARLNEKISNSQPTT